MTGANVNNIVLRGSLVQESLGVAGMLTFDGTIESIKCIAQEENFEAMTNKAVLVNVGPLQKYKDGKHYRLHAGTPENEEVQHCSCQLYI